MTYTIQIKDTDSELAKNLVDYLKSLANTKEYGFLHVIEGDIDELSQEQKDELDERYKHFLKHKSEYQDWDDVKHKYLK